MKKIRKIFSLFIVIMLAICLTACGGDGGNNDKTPDSLKLGDVEIIYKDAFLTKDSEGKDTLIFIYDFKNNGSEKAVPFWSTIEYASQDGEDVEYAYLSMEDEYGELVENQYKDVEGGESIEVLLSYILNDTKTEVDIYFEDMYSSDGDTITIEIASLEFKELKLVDDGIDDTNLNYVDVLDWWNGEWYGWWMMSNCEGYYEGMDGQWWDISGLIDIDDDYTGTITLWDEDYSLEEPMAIVDVALDEDGFGDYGVMTSGDGWFTDMLLAPGDWVSDPGLLEYQDMIYITGYYENGEDKYSYDIYLRPWGLYWTDIDDESLPKYYYDWYLEMISQGISMPGVIGTGLTE